MSGMRLHYIDVFKGICILLVVIHHTLLSSSPPHTHLSFDYTWLNNIIIAFFMPAFFVATGFCSHFDIGFKSFFRKNVQTILLPCFCLYYLNRYLDNLNVLLFGDSSWLTLKEWLAPGLRTFIKDNGFYWFLSALFIAKLLIWTIYRFIPKPFYWPTVVCASISGIVIYQYHLLPNVWFFQHALILTLFLHIGHWGKKYETCIMQKGLIVTITFIGSILLLTAFGVVIPTVTRDITVTITTAPIFITLSIWGTVSVWWISHCIAHNKLLESLGRESIVIYCFNYSTLVLVGNMLKQAIPLLPSARTELITLLSTFIVSIILLHIMGIVINSKYLKFLLGRF